MEKLFFIAACLLALGSTPVMAQTGGPDVAVVRISESLAGRVLITVSRGPGQTETKVDTTIPQNINKNQSPLAEAYQQAVVSMLQQGYTLKGMSGGDNLATLVFVKER